MSSFSFTPGLVLPGNVQTIAPATNWGTAITVNYQGVPSIEADIQREVASAGKQLGILTEAVLALAAPVEAGLGDDAREKIARLRRLAERVEAVKARNRDTVRRQIRDQMASLVRTDPDAAESLVEVLRADVRLARELADDAPT